MSKLFKSLTISLGILLIAAFPLVGAVNSTNMEMTKKSDSATTQESFATFALLLNKSGLMSIMQGKESLTVFAPTDKAFEALDQEKFKELMMPDKADELKEILLFHIVPKQISISDIDKQVKEKTLEGGELDLTIHGDTLHVNDAKVVGDSIKTSNGIIFTIDKVLIPPKTD